MNSLTYNQHLIDLITRLERELTVNDHFLRDHIANMRLELRELINKEKKSKGFPRSQQTPYKRLDWKPIVTIK
jgi:hypothetical protein